MLDHVAAILWAYLIKIKNFNVIYRKYYVDTVDMFMAFVNGKYYVDHSFYLPIGQGNGCGWFSGFQFLWKAYSCEHEFRNRFFVSLEQIAVSLERM